MFDKIKIWSQMSTSQRLTFTTGVIIVALSCVIIHYENKSQTKDELHRSVINNIVTRHSAREAALEAKLEVCNQNYLLYLQKSEAEYRDLLFQAKKLKEKITDENIK